MARWTFPDPHQYLVHFPAIVRAFGGRAFAHGTAHHVAGFVGAALWLRPGIEPDEEALTAVVRASVAPARQAAAFAMFEQMGRHHPHEPHWYQGQGHGSALLRHALRRCDEDHVPAYLESTNRLNIPLYERHGFKPLTSIQVESSPPMVPMLRAPRG